MNFCAFCMFCCHFKIVLLLLAFCGPLKSGLLKYRMLGAAQNRALQMCTKLHHNISKNYSNYTVLSGNLQTGCESNNIYFVLCIDFAQSININRFGPSFHGLRVWLLSSRSHVNSCDLLPPPQKVTCYTSATCMQPYAQGDWYLRKIILSFYALPFSG